MKDLTKQNGNRISFLLHEEFIDKFITCVNFLDFLSLVNAIPAPRKDMLIHHHSGEIESKPHIRKLCPSSNTNHDMEI